MFHHTKQTKKFQIKYLSHIKLNISFTVWPTHALHVSLHNFSLIKIVVSVVHLVNISLLHDSKKYTFQIPSLNRGTKFLETYNLTLRRNSPNISDTPAPATRS
jgi:hypothetical protein